MKDPKREIALFVLARRAIDGDGPEVLGNAAVEALGAFEPERAARSIGERLARAALDPSEPGSQKGVQEEDVALREALAIVRSAARKGAAMAERYRSMLERASDGIYIVDASGRYVEANASGAAMLGFTKDELHRLHIHDLVDPTDPPIDMAAVRSGQSITRYRSLRKKDGGFMLAELSSHMLADGTLFGIARDVTERVRAERELRESAARFRHALRAARAGAWEWAGEEGKARWSEETFVLMGVPPRDGPVGFDEWVACVHPDDRARNHAAMVRATENRTDFDAVYRVVHPDGAIRWIQTVGKMVVGDDGKPVGMYGIHLDVTEKKAAELDRAEAEEKLQQARRMEAIGRLAGGIAHDFNNLLTVIVAASEVVAGEIGNDPRLAEHVEGIRQAGARGAALTRQLLALGEQRSAAPSVVDVGVQVDRIVPILRRLLGVEIDIRVSKAERAPLVLIDPTQLDQVVLNLAINARDAMPRGGVLELATTVEDDGAVVLRVTDDGIGMDAETRARIFEPFFTTKPTGSGTGLGLANVYGIVRSAGGDIDLETTPARGTTFWIRFPACAAAPESSPEPERAPCAQRAKASVLLVEDDPNVRTVIRRVLEDAGHRVIDAGDAAQALRLVKAARERIDAVLSDVVMPGMSGPELTACLRVARPGLPALLMSGYVGDALARHGIAPDVELIQKPFTPAVLLDALERALASSS